MKFIIIFLLLVVLALGGGVAGLYLGFFSQGEQPTKSAASTTPSPTPEPTAEPEEPMTPERMKEVVADPSLMVPRDSRAMEEYYHTHVNKDQRGAGMEKAATSDESLGDTAYEEIDYEDAKERYKAKERVSRDIGQQQWELERNSFSHSNEEEKREKRAHAMEEWVKKNQGK